MGITLGHKYCWHRTTEINYINHRIEFDTEFGEAVLAQPLPTMCSLQKLILSK